MKLPAAASIEQGSEMLGLLDAALAAESAGTLSIDASALANFDTSTLALLLEAQRRAKAQGREITVNGVPHKLVELARLYGVEELLPLAE
ncbi:MAG: STAS domain-containing protein [Rubrivivax sp.]|jgi:phospholipid transport system transporter-binding protein|nr:STAS domain-containing protein [Rubrivivax sp.]